MNILIFLIIGLISGWIASYIVTGRGSGLVLNLLIGVIGAFVGGFLFRALNVATYSIWGSIGMSVVGAICLLLVIGLFYRKRFLIQKH